MLVIREEQIQHFIAETDADLVKVIAGAIREAAPDRVADYEDDLLERMVKIGIERAKIYELSRAEDIAAFVALMFEIAPNFDEQVDIKAVLTDPLLAPDFRFYQLFERVSDDAWKTAEGLYADSIWFPAEMDAVK